MTASAPASSVEPRSRCLLPPQPLICHPSCAAGTEPGFSITASVQGAAGPAGDAWCLRYEVRGDVATLLLPEKVQQPGPADGLWRHTCFEAFAAPNGSTTYQEFNFSPSGQWAHYRFSAERVRDTASEASGMTLHALPIQSWTAPGLLVLEAWLPTSLLIPDVAGETLDLGLTAVLETTDHQLSYWALQHPGAQPDFHHRQGFVAQAATPTR